MDKTIQMQPPEVFYKKTVLENLPKFTGKHLRQSPYLINFITKESLAEMFSCESCEIFKNILFTVNLRRTASTYWIAILLR